MSSSSTLPPSELPQPQLRGQQPPRIQPVRYCVTLGVALLATFVVLGAMDTRSLFVATLLSFAIGLLSLRLSAAVIANFRQLFGTSTSTRVVAIVTGAVVAPAVLLLLDRWLQNGALGLAAVAVAYLTIGVTLTRFRTGEPGPSVAAWITLAIGIALSGLGVALAAVGGLPTLIPLGLLGLGAVAFAPIGFSLTSEIISRRFGDWPAWRYAAVAAGAVVAAVGFAAWLLHGSDLAFVAVLAVVGVAVLLMVGFAARSNVDVITVIVAAAVVWAIGHQQSVPVPPELEPSEDQPVLAAFGDSYMSGEGATDYFENTNSDGDDTRCRRAPTAYPVLLIERPPTLAQDGEASTQDDDPTAPTDDEQQQRDQEPEQLPEQLAFQACTGAVIDQVVAQAEELPLPIRNQVDVALVSMGGNDTYFSTLVQACLSPADCSELGEAYTRRLEQVEQHLITAYGQIAAAVPAHTELYVMPYPIPVRETGCRHSVLSRAEHRFLEAFTRELNQTVRDAVQASGTDFVVVDPVETAFQERQLRVCDGATADTEGVNFLAANGVLGSVGEGVNPLNWTHNSFHPNARGHAAIYEALSNHLAGLDPAEDGTAELRSGSTEGDTLERTTACLDADDLKACTQRWTIEETARGLLWRFVPLSGLLVTAWAAALALVGLWRGLLTTTDAPTAPAAPGADA